MDAIVKAFALTPTSDEAHAPCTGQVGGSSVTCIHIGMGPPLTRAALGAVFDDAAARQERVDHVMIAGICGGLDPDLPVGTLINPEIIVEQARGTAYAHHPPGDTPRQGKLITTEEATLDVERSKRFFAEGFVAVDMESSAVAEVCQEKGCPWSVYRCIGDRWFDGLLDERLLAATNPDGSGNMEAIGRLLAAEPELAARLDRLGRETAHAARLAAEAAVRGCLALSA
jgi:adenosylhomocysteine nucleosidase